MKTVYVYEDLDVGVKAVYATKEQAVEQLTKDYIAHALPCIVHSHFQKGAEGWLPCEQAEANLVNEIAATLGRLNDQLYVEEVSQVWEMEVIE